MAARRSNGDGSFYIDERGRWVGQGYVSTLDGPRHKRFKVYGATRQEAHDKLMLRLSLDRNGKRARQGEWTIAEYLDYWFHQVIQKTRKERTQEFYESAIRLYLKPALGHIKLKDLGVQDVQRAFNSLLQRGTGARTVQKLQQTLRAALTQAEREELLLRNVARLIVLPKYSRKQIVPWTLDQQRAFLASARGHRWSAGYALLLLYGLRRGEVLGLLWSDVDYERGIIHVRRQLQRINGKGLTTGSVKTAAGERTLPLTPPAVQALEGTPGKRGANDFVFTSSTGTPVDPKNFVRAFHEIRERAGLPFVTVQQLRHAAATNLKDHGVAATDAQSILGHAHVSTTMQIYTHSNLDTQRSGLGRVHADLADSMDLQMALQQSPDDRNIDAMTPVAERSAA